MKAQSQKKTKTLDPDDNEANLAKPKKRDRSVSEARLLKAAEETFSKYGFAATTTKLIAQKAKLNEALIARYFGSKMGLLIAIVQAHIAEKHDKLDYALKNSLEEELTAYIQNKLEDHCAHSVDFFKIVLSQMLVDQKFAKRMRAEAPMDADPNLVERLQQLTAQGKMRSGIDLTAFAQAIQVHIHGIFLFDQVLMGLTREDILPRLLYARDIFTQFGSK